MHEHGPQRTDFGGDADASHGQESNKPFLSIGQGEAQRLELERHVTDFTATSAGTESRIGAKLRIAFTPDCTSWSTTSCAASAGVTRMAMSVGPSSGRWRCGAHPHERARSSGSRSCVDPCHRSPRHGSHAAGTPGTAPARPDAPAPTSTTRWFRLRPRILPQPSGELGHGVPEPALAEGAEEREVLAHLRRRGGARGGPARRRNGGRGPARRTARGIVDRGRAAARCSRKSSAYCE